MQTQITLAELATRLGGEVVGDGSTPISSADDVRDTAPGGIVFAEGDKYLREALDSSCSAVITRSDLLSKLGGHSKLEAASDSSAEIGSGGTLSKPLILVPQPRLAFAQVLQLLVRSWNIGVGVHPDASIEEGVTLGNAVRIGPQVWIEAGAEIGDGVTLMPGVKIGAGCVIGAGTILYPNVVLYPNVRIGRGCIVHAGCVIGSDGFGYVPTPTGLLKIPHAGSVEIGDGVEIGANSCIDRAKTGVTKVGAGTKIDNLVHIAHNVHIGRASVLVAQTGIAGSVRIGDGVMLGGQSGIADHLTIGDGARVGAQGGVIGDVLPKQSVSGYPARPHSRKMREYAAMSALPEYLRRIRALEKRVAELEGSGDPLSDESIK